jgi:pimeloyl-ACP methyl ester carboxylesterase
MAMLKKPDKKYYFGPRGKKLCVLEWGAEDKPVVLLIHGFPGCAEHAKLMSQTPYWDSFRLISMDRPGYGESDVQKNITPLNFAKQIESLLNEKKIQNFSIISVSGGAPYSFAIAYLLQDRVLKMCSIAGVAPITLKTFFMMNTQQQKAWVLQKVFPRLALSIGFDRVWQKGIDKMDDLLFTRMHEFSIHDQKVFSHPEIGPELIASTKMALKNGPGGVIDDMYVFGKKWGFDLFQIKTPITFWHGTGDDVVHKRFSKEMSRRVPKSRLRIVPNEGHYSLLLNHRDVILEDLLNLK